MRYGTQQVPNGDAFLALTPEIDHARDVLFQQQNQREMAAQHQSMELDQQMAKDIGQTRGRDVPEIMKGYQNYKGIMQDVMFNKKLARDPVALASRKQEADQALADTFSQINDSKQTKQMSEDLLKYNFQHPEKLQDNFADLHKTLQSTPLSGLKNAQVGGKTYDLSDASTYFDNSPGLDMGAIDKTARGTTINDRSSEDVPMGATQINRTTYKYGASPAQYVESVKGQLMKPGNEKAATRAFKSMSPDEINGIQQQYNSLTPADWKQRTGSETPDDLNLDNAHSDAERYAILQGMKYAVNNKPSAKVSTITNEDKKLAVQQSNGLVKQTRSFNFREHLQQTGAALAEGNKEAFDGFERNKNDLSEKQADQVATTYLAGQMKAARAKPPVNYTDTKGNKIDVYHADVPSEVKEELAIHKGGHVDYPKETGFSKDGSQVIGIFPKEDGKVETTSQPTSIVLPLYKKRLYGGKASDKAGGNTTPSGKIKIPGL